MAYDIILYLIRRDRAPLIYRKARYRHYNVLDWPEFRASEYGGEMDYIALFTRHEFEEFHTKNSLVEDVWNTAEGKFLKENLHDEENPVTFIIIEYNFWESGLN
jgi:hypothetical protein